MPLPGTTAEPLAGFAVMGGVFGEGIDLIGDRLSGVAVVGVGLPQIGLTRELLRMYFEETRQEGYAYAYVYPGFNKVQQAVGRLIRSDEDYGAVLLIDDRLPGEPYTELFPDAWQPLPVLEDALEMAETLEAFWAQKRLGEELKVGEAGREKRFIRVGESSNAYRSPGVWDREGCGYRMGLGR